MACTLNFLLSLHSKSSRMRMVFMWCTHENMFEFVLGCTFGALSISVGLILCKIPTPGTSLPPLWPSLPVSLLQFSRHSSWEQVGATESFHRAKQKNKTHSCGKSLEQPLLCPVNPAAAGAGMGHVHGAGTAAGAQRQRNVGCTCAVGSWASHNSEAAL